MDGLEEVAEGEGEGERDEAEGRRPVLDLLLRLLVEPVLPRLARRLSTLCAQLAPLAAAPLEVERAEAAALVRLGRAHRP